MASSESVQFDLEANEVLIRLSNECMASFISQTVNMQLNAECSVTRLSWKMPIS